MEEHMPEGTVKEFDERRGTGTILAENGEELTVHRSAIEDDGLRALHSGDIVEFTTGRNKFGRRCALQVRRIGWEENGGDSPREWSF
jgi:cold shock CspA family protein